MILGKICSWSILQCGQVKSEYRSIRKGAAGLPTLLLSGPAARQGSIRASARANIFILLCYTKQLHTPPAGGDVEELDRDGPPSEPRPGYPLGREGSPWPGSKRLCRNPLADARGSDWRIPHRSPETWCQAGFAAYRDIMACNLRWRAIIVLFCSA